MKISGILTKVSFRINCNFLSAEPTLRTINLNEIQTRQFVALTKYYEIHVKFQKERHKKVNLNDKDKLLTVFELNSKCSVTILHRLV